MKLFCRTDRWVMPRWWYGYVREEDFGQQILWCLVPFHILARAYFMAQLAWWQFLWYGFKVDHASRESWIGQTRKNAYLEGEYDGINYMADMIGVAFSRLGYSKGQLEQFLTTVRMIDDSNEILRYRSYGFREPAQPVETWLP